MRAVRELRSGGGDGGVGGTYFQIVSGEGVGAEEVEGEDEVVGGTAGSTAWKTGVAVSVRQRVSLERKSAIRSTPRDTETTYLVLCTLRCNPRELRLK